MTPRKRNRLIVLAFLLGTTLFTGLLTFYYGPRMMSLRDSVEEGKLLFKCQQIIDGNTVELQLRSWQRPNTNPLVRVSLAGLDTPPNGKADDEAVAAWASSRGIPPALAARIGASAENALRAFVRKQNLVIERADGQPVTAELLPGTPVHLFVSGSHVNLKQLQHGLALHDRSRPHGHADAMAAKEADARKAHLGLWAEAD